MGYTQGVHALGVHTGGTHNDMGYTQGVHTWGTQRGTHMGYTKGYTHGVHRGGTQGHTGGSVLLAIIW